MGTPAKATHVIFFEAGEQPLERPAPKLEQDRVAWMRMLVVEGKLVYWGPYRDHPGEMSVIVAKSDEEAQRIADGDPAVKAKVLSAEVRPWDVRVSGPGFPVRGLTGTRNGN